MTNDRPLSPPWPVTVLVALIVVDWYVYLTVIVEIPDDGCGPENHYCDGFDGLYELFFLPLLLLSTLALLFAWGMWRRRGWAWYLALIFFGLAIPAYWLLALRSLELAELRSLAVGILNLVVVVFLCLPSVIHWCRPSSGWGYRFGSTALEGRETIPIEPSAKEDHMPRRNGPDFRKANDDD
ncbi:hypothetical protein [Glycomyces arizonensis]|uniref:hypothetical protein n=1 Tax=Glycomyces arizonensis TaxID=256035 RepID=UPI000478E54A|nr:hypothetical protein [Glycomyces arizonensis]